MSSVLAGEIPASVCVCVCDTLGKAKYKWVATAVSDYASTMDEKDRLRVQITIVCACKSVIVVRVGRLIVGKHCGSIV